MERLRSRTQGRAGGTEEDPPFSFQGREGDRERDPTRAHGGGRRGLEWWPGTLLDVERARARAREEPEGARETRETEEGETERVCARPKK
jgi:hypothetical protein